MKEAAVLHTVPAKSAKQDSSQGFKANLDPAIITTVTWNSNRVVVQEAKRVAIAVGK